MNRSKVIGFIAFVSKGSHICSGDALFVADSEKAMYDYVADSKPELKNVINTRKIRLENVMNSLEKGAAFAFNIESYKRFYPLAKELGLPVENINFDEAEKQENSLFIVRTQKKET